MKTRTRPLAKPGIYGSEDNPQVVTVSDLKEIAETFPDIRRAPISLNGHWPDPSRPRMGNVIAVTWDEAAQILTGEAEEQDALAKAVDEGWYPDVSIGSKRRASDGKMYLHHLAYLGEEPPAIKDLIDQIMGTLAEPTETPPAPDQIAAGDEGDAVIIPPISSRILNLADKAKKPQQPHPKEGSRMPKTPEELQQELDTEKAKTLALSDQVRELTASSTSHKETMDALAAKYPDEELLLSDRADPRVTGLQAQLRRGKADALRSAAAGKLPKGKLPLLDALAGQLSLGETIELSDGDAKTKVDGFTLVTRIFESIPSPVAPGRLDLGDPAEGEPSKVTPRDHLKNL